MKITYNEEVLHKYSSKGGATVWLHLFQRVFHGDSVSDTSDTQSRESSTVESQQRLSINVRSSESPLIFTQVQTVQPVADIIHRPLGHWHTGRVERGISTFKPCPI